MKDDFDIKRLGLADWRDLKAIRLDALKQDPQFFLRRYEDEILQGDEFWQKSFAADMQDKRAIFGVYAQSRIIGMGGVSPDNDDADGARLGGGYIAKAYRGNGFAHRLISARIAWARANPAYRSLYLSHRLGNAPSQTVALKAGFALLKQQRIQWPDGGYDDELIYRLTL